MQSNYLPGISQKAYNSRTDRSVYRYFFIYLYYLSIYIIFL